MNQCDGCRQNLPVDKNNNHKLIHGYPGELQSCTKDLYVELKTVNNVLHHLWTKAVGTPSYRKGEWRLLEAILSRGMTPSMNLPEDLKGWSYK